MTEQQLEPHFDPQQLARALAEMNRTYTEFREAIRPVVQQAVANLARAAEAVRAAQNTITEDYALAPPPEKERPTAYQCEPGTRCNRCAVCWS